MALGALTLSFPGHTIAVKTCSESVLVKRSFLTLTPSLHHMPPLPPGQTLVPCGHHLNGAIKLVMDEACLNSYTAEPLDDT